LAKGDTGILVRKRLALLERLAPQGDSLTGPQGLKQRTARSNSPSSTGPQGSTGATGPAGVDGKTVLNGAGVPSGSLGNLGDFYINTAASTLYGPKSAGGWGNPVSLVGPQGIQGATGPQGTQGATGPQGTQGATGPQGTQGATGPQGPTGNTGPQGIQGATGPQGPAGPSTFAGGGNLGAAATSTTTGTITVSMTTSVITITPTGACTFNASGGIAGQRITFVITTSGTTSFTLTWGTNFKTTATLATGTTTAKKFCVSFVCVDGTQWVETGRTAAM
jgi:hypothetical protein